MASLFDKVSQGASVYGKIAPFVRSVLDLKKGDTVRDERLLGGFTLREARAITAAINDNSPARKNLFRVDVVGPALTAAELGGIADEGALQVPQLFYLFATDVSYAPVTLTGERRQIGSTTADGAQKAEHVEISITTMDDERGILKRWFRALAAKVANPNGTVGLPNEYAVAMTITHAFASSEAPGAANAYKDSYFVRPQSMTLETSRSEQAPQMVQMVFSEIDGFDIPKGHVAPTFY